MKFFLVLFIIFLVLSCNQSSNSKEINYRKLVDKQAEFIGQGIKVPQADIKWDWLLPDLNSTAQKSSQAYEKPAGIKGAEYLRSFKLYDDIGFVWSWQHKDLEIFLIYTFMGTNGYYIRTLHNTHNITVDEAILAVFFDNEFSSYLQSFDVEKWQILGVDDDYDIEALGFLGQEMFSQSSGFKLFEERIITLPWKFVKYENNNYHLCDSYYSSIPCFILPPSFEKLLKSQNLVKEIQSKNYLKFLLKVKIGKTHQIREVLAGNIIRDNDDETSEMIVQWLIPMGYLGAGSQPFYIETD